MVGLSSTWEVEAEGFGFQSHPKQAMLWGWGQLLVIKDCLKSKTKQNETTNKTFSLYAYNTACPYFFPIPTRKTRIFGAKIRIFKRREMNKEDETNLNFVLSFKTLSPFYACM